MARGRAIGATPLRGALRTAPCPSAPRQLLLRSSHVAGCSPQDAMVVRWGTLPTRTTNSASNSLWRRRSPPSPARHPLLRTRPLPTPGGSILIARVISHTLRSGNGGPVDSRYRLVGEGRRDQLGGNRRPIGARIVTTDSSRLRKKASQRGPMMGALALASRSSSSTASSAPGRRSISSRRCSALRR